MDPQSSGDGPDIRSIVHCALFFSPPGPHEPVPRSAIPYQCGGAGPFPSRQGARSGGRGALQLRQIQRHQCPAGPAWAGPHQPHAGRTQLYNYFELAPGKRMVDLPGYGHASVPGVIRATWGPMGDALLHRGKLCRGAGRGRQQARGGGPGHGSAGVGRPAAGTHPRAAEQGGQVAAWPALAALREATAVLQALPAASCFLLTREVEWTRRAPYCGAGSSKKK